MRRNTLNLIRFLILLCATSFLYNCSTANTSKQNIITITFLDEFIIDNDTLFAKNKIGGLSGIDYDPISNTYILVSDDPITPRYYTATIDIIDNRIQNVRFDSVIYFQKQKNSVTDSQHFDLQHFW